MKQNINTNLKEIGILEYRYHSIFFYSLARICNTKDTHVTLFTTKEILSLVENHLENKDQYTIILKEDDESINSFLKRVKKICNKKMGLLFVNTIQESCKDLPHYLRFKLQCKMILTVHDANTWLNQKFTIDIKKPFRTLDTIISSIIIQKIVLPKFDGINVVYPPIKDYILNNNLYNKEIYTFPFALFDNKKEVKLKDNHKKIKFVVPGAIIESRRDHEIIIDAFENLFENFNEKISLCLLGKPTGTYGKRMIKRCKKLKERGFDIRFFESFVPEKIYDQTIEESSVVIAPIKLKTTSLGTWKETFGLTKASGAPFEALQYAKPLVVPKKFNIIEELKSSTLKYTTSKDLEITLSEIINDKKKLLSLEENALENSKKLSFSTYKKYFENNLLNRI